MDRKMKHIEMIQGVISRMTRNSFMLKGWTITVPTESYLEYEDNICIAGYDGMNLLRYK